MGNVLTRFEACTESILVGTTKKELWLERQCAELARQNEQLRTKLLPVQGSVGDLQESLSVYNAQNFAHLAGAPSSDLPEGGAGLEPLTPLVNNRRGSAAALATLAVAAVAEEAADYQSSLVSVEIDNEAYDTKTEVTVRAPNRERLLADMNGALIGLGLLVLEARFTSEDAQAVYTFFVQDSTGHKVQERPRLEAIRQRLQQRFWGEQGLNGGVRRLVVDRYIPAMPPWEHETLEPLAPQPHEESAWLATVAAALRGGSALGPLAPALAAHLAADLLPGMQRMRLRPGSKVYHDSTEGEWLLLVEGGARVSTDACASPKERRRTAVRASPTSASAPSAASQRDQSPGMVRLSSIGSTASDAWMTPLTASTPTSLSAGGALVFGVSTREEDGGEARGAAADLAPPAAPLLQLQSSANSVELPPGSVLWDLWTTPEGLASGVQRQRSRERERRWGVLSAARDGAALDIRVLHLNTVRSRLAALRESLARQHSQILAAMAVFAPLDTPRLLALCRRATLVEVPAGTTLLEQGRAFDYSQGAEGSWEITATTFGVVVDGELQMCLRLPEEHREPAGLPPLLPLARLSRRSTFGEIGALTDSPLPAGISMRSEGGARLLCWPRDPLLVGELQQLVGDSKDGTKRPSIVEGSWLARTPLALLIELPHLACCLRPTALSQLLRGGAGGAGGAEVRDTDTMLVIEGEVVKDAHHDAMLEVHVLTEANGGVPDKYAGGDALNGQLELVVAARLPSRCTTNGAVAGLSAGLNDLGLRVRDANLSLLSGVAHNAFHVILPAGDPRPAAERAREVQAKIQALQGETLRPGDAMPLLSDDGSSRVRRLRRAAGTADATDAAAGRLALVDLGALAALLASGDSGLAPLWRRFLQCTAPGLQLPATLEAQPAAAGGKPAGVPGGWYATLCAFCLFRLRQQTNEPEVGVEVHDLELGPKLGEGGYGVVHLARHRVSGALFAVKSFTKAKIRRVEERTTYMRLERERKTLRLMQAHLRGGAQPYGLVRLICSGHDPEKLRLVLPFYGGGDLSQLLGDLGKLPTEHVQFYAGCVILALMQLHTLGIAYRDLKPENILLTPDGWPVVTDFGLVAFLDEGRATSMVGTPEFMPPEIVTGTGHTTDADWWSLGVTLCELLTLTTPFCEPEAPTNHEKTYANIVHGRFSKAFEQKHLKQLPKNTAAMLSGLLKVDPQERLGGLRRGTESIRCHPFFWGLNWEALEARELTPPYGELCQCRAKEVTAQFEECALHGSLMVMPQCMSRRQCTPSNGERQQDAAAAAMDRMFDFSAW